VTGHPVIVGALRTPIGTSGRSLSGVTAADLGATVLRGLRPLLDEHAVEPHEVVLGNCMGPGGDVARVATLAAGFDVSVPALTVDRQCASGLAAIALAVTTLRADPGTILAGGVESVSTAPWRMWPPLDGGEPVRYERAPFAPTAELDPDMGVSNDLLAAEHGITRERQDEYAARSHARAAAAIAAGAYDAELVPVGDVVRDDRPRQGLTVERLARLRPAFREGGTVTAGNSCGISDGAAAVAVVDSETHEALGIPGLRVLAVATAGVDPRRPGIGLVPAVERAVIAAGIGFDELDVIEINEAFAGQVIACCDALGLDPARVCPEGGALALGHPWGASGAVLVVRLFSQLVLRDGGRYGLAAIAAGGGQGVAMVVERCP
jgi:acetyl-CoA C-acetyltransferase